MRPLDPILQELRSFSPVDEDWRPLDALLSKLWEAGVREEQLPLLFDLFERFPEDDGAGVLWGIVHGIEALPFDYEAALRSSLARGRSMMGEIMLRRLENSRST
ncbi:hypothetical protein [Rhizobacter sp. LjRoot28]|uniref:hypothetical protein n=1 Tax=Rhizobacter sp. LjRoot28 TaxID=3342309 RepID=UPI003ED0F1C5